MRSKDWIKGALFGFGLTAIAGAGFGAVAHERSVTNKVAVDKTVVSQGISDALQQLAQLEKINDRNRDRRTSGRIHSGLHALRADLEALEAHVEAADPVGDRDWDRDDRRGDRYDDRRYDNDDVDDYGRDNHVTYTMRDSEVDSLIAAMNATISSSSKLAILREGISGRWISVAQLARLMDELAYSSDRVDCAVSLHANLSDPENFYQVYSHLPFEADRDSLRQRLNK